MVKVSARKPSKIVVSTTLQGIIMLAHFRKRKFTLYGIQAHNKANMCHMPTDIKDDNNKQVTSMIMLMSILHEPLTHLLTITLSSICLFNSNPLFLYIPHIFPHLHTFHKQYNVVMKINVCMLNVGETIGDLD